jgi:hypothetical protein
MRTATINYYKFDELSDKAKDRARDWWRHSGLEHDWWDSIYEDAERVGVKITGFDTGRSWDITGDFIGTPEETANKILAEHGEDADTAAEARHYLKTVAEFMASAEKDEYGELASYALEADLDDIITEFRRALLQGYLVMLRDELEYQYSEECVDELLTANEYEFTEDGKIV